MGNILCGPTNNTSNLENIVEPIKEKEVIKEEAVKEEEVILQNDEPIKEAVLQEEPVLQNEELVKEETVLEAEPIKEEELVKEPVLEEEPLDESVGSDASSTTSSVNDTTPLVTNEKLNEEPVKKKRGRKKKAN